MSTIRDQSTRTLAEALEAVPWEPVDDPLDTVTYDEAARLLLAASPTLAADLDFATAWRMAKAECKRLGWVFEGVYILSDRSDWGAYAYEPMTEDGTSHEAGQQTEEGHGPDETAALVALTAALRDRAR